MAWSSSSTAAAQLSEPRTELTTQDVVALERGMEITVSAIDEEQDSSEHQVDVTISLLGV